MRTSTSRARQRLLAALAFTALLCAVAAGPGPADASAASPQPIVHQTPKVPIVVDGVRYAPRQIHRFDGRPLYMRVTANRKALVAYTKRVDFDAALRRAVTRTKSTARTSGWGHWLKFCTDGGQRGTCNYLDSGYGIPNFGRFGAVGNAISSLQVVGQNIVLYDQPDFNFHTWGDVLALGPGYHDDLRLYGFDNKIESMFMFW